MATSNRFTRCDVREIMVSLAADLAQKAISQVRQFIKQHLRSKMDEDKTEQVAATREK
jgi:ribosomal protein L31E